MEADTGVNVLDRFRRFWRPGPDPDHPLSEEERESVPPQTAFDELASTLGGFVGTPFDPDDRPWP
jgi:hypothetical protein